MTSDRVGGEHIVREEPLAFGVEARCEFVNAATGPRRQRRIVKRPNGGTGRDPRLARRKGWLAEMAESTTRERSERECRRLPPEDLRSRNRCSAHRFDLEIGACLVCVDLHEHVADAQRRPLAVSHQDLDPVHPGHHRKDNPPMPTVFSMRRATGGR